VIVERADRGADERNGRKFGGELNSERRKTGPVFQARGNGRKLNVIAAGVRTLEA
jgi:hypothetical protein